MEKIFSILTKKNKLTINDCAFINTFISNNIDNRTIMEKVFYGQIEDYNIAAIKCLVRYSIIYKERLPERTKFVDNVLDLFHKKNLDCTKHFRGLNSELSH